MLNYYPVDQVFHALADPARRAMVERLCHAPATVSALAEPLGISLPAAMQHLQVLEASGLVRSEKVGRVRTCQLEPAALRTAEDWLRKRRLTWSRVNRPGEIPVEDGDGERDGPAGMAGAG
ncbi:MAG TPA: metalloregulator ArsR/SmtB family transcription factor [Longimicrobium sp.]